MDEYFDADYVEGEVEIIELEDAIVEEGIIDFEDGAAGIVESLSDLEAIGDQEPEEILDTSTLTFSKHTKSIFQGVLNAAGTIAATGSEDDIAYVWETATGHLIMECTGHKDSVTQLVFNFDEQLLATGDLSGLIQVWNLKEKKLVWCYEADDLEWLLWHPKANVLFAGGQLGNVFVWQVPSGSCKVLASRGSAATCGQILSDGVRLLAGYANGQIRLWDIKAASVIWELQQNIPGNGVTSLDISLDDNLFIVAPSAQVFKVSDGSLITTLLTTNEVDVEVVAFSHESGFVATGALSGTACIWDLKTYSLRHEAKLEAAITVVKWSSNDKLVVGSANAIIYIIDAKGVRLLQSLTGHRLDILSISLSKDASILLSTSDDSTAKVFAVTNDFLVST